jgi:NodT family efflux transporter outer membrane factor (OMF) lipoprotein
MTPRFALKLPLRPLAAGAAGALLVGACALGPDFERPAPPEAHRYTAAPPAAAAPDGGENEAAAQVRVAAGPAPARWWTSLGSPTLDAWVDEGLARNRDLQATAANLRAARDLLEAQVGQSELPTAGAGLQFERERAIGLPTFGPPTLLYHVYGATVQVDYDLDLFGAVRRGNEATRANVEAQAQELAAARQTLAANVVAAAVRSAALRRQVQVQERIAELAQQRAQLVRRRYDLGGSAHREVLEAARAAREAAAALPGLRAQSDRARHALALLLGRLPENAPEDLDFESLHAPDEIPLAVPSDLVHARPDILAAEASLHAATAEVGVATANLFPRISLTGQYGSESYTRSNFLRSPTTVWSAGGSLLQPLFAGGALLAQKRAASAQLEAAWQRYESTVLKAFGNVGDALRALQEDAQALAQTAQAEDDAERFLRETARRHENGSESRLAVIASELALQQERLARIGGQTARLVDTANLYQAIGAPAS